MAEDPNVTVRERAVRRLVQIFEDVKEGLPVGDPYTVQWSLVLRQRAGARADKKRYVLQVFDTTESKVAQVGWMDCTLRVILEFVALVDSKADPSRVGNRVLGEIQRRVREDIYLNDTVLNVVEVGNELDVDGTTDRQITGAVFVNVRYKHDQNDPRSDVGSFP